MWSQLDPSQILVKLHICISVSSTNSSPVSTLHLPCDKSECIFFVYFIANQHVSQQTLSMCQQYSCSHAFNQGVGRDEGLLLRFIYLLILWIWMSCLHACMCTCVPADLLKLDLWMFVRHCVGTGNQSPVLCEWLSALNNGAIAPAPEGLFCIT